MSNDDGIYRSAAGRRRSRRRTRLTVIGVGLAAVLGGGGYAATTRLATDQNLAVAPGDRALAPPPAFSPPPLPAVPPLSAPPLSSSPLSLPPLMPARSAARHSVSVAPSASLPASLPPPASSPPPALVPPPASSPPALAPPRSPASSSPPPDLAAAGLAPGWISERTERRPNGSLRIISARSDLTGRRELLWAADGGRPIDKVNCTQNLHFSDDARPAIQPNLLLCWRTSATRSVATLLSDRGGHPSIADSVDTIDREWAGLG
ncbi:hypothetical protein [Actinoplanes sp. NPDC026619]|uniref:hypothetical protein n=1 Tax=Actinoplanes sp. NPDC026619 TaxID=3155798 RepID=UPI0033DF58CF